MLLFSINESWIEVQLFYSPSDVEVGGIKVSDAFVLHVAISETDGLKTTERMIE